MPERHPFIPSPQLKMNLFHSPSICQMENLGLLLAGAIPVVFQGERIVEQVPLSALSAVSFGRFMKKQIADVFFLAGKHLTQRPLYPFHSISNLVSKFLLLWD